MTKKRKIKAETIETEAIRFADKLREKGWDLPEATEEGE